MLVFIVLSSLFQALPTCFAAFDPGLRRIRSQLGGGFPGGYDGTGRPYPPDFDRERQTRTAVEDAGGQQQAQHGQQFQHPQQALNQQQFQQHPA
ncbi:unnamed protein product, partial [Amoebophrya sp. A25]|eukprot:GSA25T00002599001.1